MPDVLKCDNCGEKMDLGNVAFKSKGTKRYKLEHASPKVVAGLRKLRRQVRDGRRWLWRP